MKLAVVCANGRAGSLVLKEAVERGLDVTAMNDETVSGNHIQGRISAAENKLAKSGSVGPAL